MSKPGLRPIGLMLLALILLWLASTPGATAASVPGGTAPSLCGFEPHLQTSLAGFPGAEARLSPDQAGTKKVTLPLRLGSRAKDEVPFTIKVTRPGLVTVSVTWKGTAKTLEASLEGSGRSYRSVSGRSPLSLSYTISTRVFNSVDKWTVRLINSNGGSATGTVTITYPG